MGGILARAAYEVELGGIRELWQGAEPSPSDDLKTWLTARAVHALKFFTFHQSTPSHAVSSLIEAGFFGCSPAKNFPLLSTSGVRADCSVRMPHASYASFLKQLPTVPDAIVDGAPAMVGALAARGIVRDVTFGDVLAELAARRSNCMKRRVGAILVRAHRIVATGCASSISIVLSLGTLT